MRSAPGALVALVRRAVEAEGLELIGVQFLSGQGGPALLRVYIDNESGVQLRHCEAVSHQLSGVLDVEDPIAGEYNLEVSSPGLDRPLFELAHFKRFIGHRVKVRLRVARSDRRNFTGTIAGVQDDGEVTLDMDEVSVNLPFEEMESARLVPEPERKTKR